MFINRDSIGILIPTGSGEFKPVGDRYLRNQPAQRQGATPGVELGSSMAVEAGTSDPSGRRGCQSIVVWS